MQFVCVFSLTAVLLASITMATQKSSFFFFLQLSLLLTLLSSHHLELLKGSTSCYFCLYPVLSFSNSFFILKSSMISGQLFCDLELRNTSKEVIEFYLIFFIPIFMQECI